MAKKMISFEIDDTLKEAIRVEAFRRSLSISAVMRELLKESLGLKNEDTEP